MKLLQLLFDALRSASKVNRSLMSAPAAVLWTDAESQWLVAIPALRELGMNVMTLGNYQPDEWQGPAIWLKCALADALGSSSRENGTLVLYLPGVSRSDLRAIESCPRHLQPLAELQYRGVFWTQANAKDWTINAFLTSKNGGLGLDVAQDHAAQQALQRALSSGELLNKKVLELEGRHIDAGWLDGLLAPNPTRDVLVWMNNPAKARAGWQGGRWDVFASRCVKDYRFDPIKDGELVAAEKLASRVGPWAAVWELYRDAYASFPAVAELLGRVQYGATGDLFADLSAYPRANEEGEAQLRYLLGTVAGMGAGDARKAIVDAERQHAERRRWLWARMGRAPLAMALPHLFAVAEHTALQSIGSTIEAQARWYREEGWRADDSALRAMASVQAKADIEGVCTVLKALYVPWLDASAFQFQKVVAAAGGLNPNGPDAASGAAGLCVIFVDGLRYDVAVRLQALLEPLGETKLGARWTSLPSVTASGKAWSSPVALAIAGKADDMDFEPNVAVNMKPLNSHNFRKLLAEAGYEPLTANETGDPSGRAWVECGDLDHFGHEHGLRLARDIEVQLRQIVERLKEFADAGWRRFRIVTDHGWLLVPGGMPKVELAKSQAETRWGRCAVLKESSTSSALTFGWDWCPQVQIAYAPGIGSFVAGAEYAHGGVSLQECLVPVLELEVAGASTQVNVAIKKVTWRGLRCNVEVLPPLPGLHADIRTKAAAANSSVALAVKPIAGGKASLAVEDDSLEGAAAVVVVLDDQGNLVAKMNTTVGE